MLRAFLERHTRHDDTIINDQVYMRRYHVIKTRWFRLRVHHIRLPDEGRHLHDHPFDFATVVMKGGYWEVLGDGRFIPHRVGRWFFRQAEMAHAVKEVATGGVWTLVLTGPMRREWGFYVDDAWVHHYDYREPIRGIRR